MPDLNETLTLLTERQLGLYVGLSQSKFTIVY